MEVERLGDGLWRWSFERRGGEQPRFVACPTALPEASVYYEPLAEAADALVLIEPLVPEPGSPDAERFWEALDADVARMGLPLAVLLGSARHTRNAHEIRRRYASDPGVSIHVPEGCELPPGFGSTEVLRCESRLPGGVRAHALDTGAQPEVAFFLTRHRALVFADAVVGIDGSRVRIASRGEDESTARDLRRSLRRLLALDPLLLLPGHGAPVRNDGGAALAEALASPPWSPVAVDP